jgi:hypothetical protein
MEGEKNLGIFTFRKKSNLQHPAVAVSTHLLLDHLLLIFMSEINTLLGKISSVWIFVNMRIEEKFARFPRRR